MLPNLINLILSQNMAPGIKNNIVQVQQTAARFDALYKSLAETLTDNQKVLISNNLDKLGPFFKSDDGKGIISMFAEEFEKYTKA